MLETSMYVKAKFSQTFWGGIICDKQTHAHAIVQCKLLNVSWCDYILKQLQALKSNSSAIAMVTTMHCFFFLMVNKDYVRLSNMILHWASASQFKTSTSLKCDICAAIYTWEELVMFVMTGHKYSRCHIAAIKRHLLVSVFEPLVNEETLRPVGPTSHINSTLWNVKTCSVAGEADGIFTT